MVNNKNEIYLNTNMYCIAPAAVIPGYRPRT